MGQQRSMETIGDNTMSYIRLTRYFWLSKHRNFSVNFNFDNVL